MAIQIKQPFEMFFNKDGSPLNNGNVYIGIAGLNPETNPISIFSDSLLTIPVAQPLKTISGFISINGSAADIYASGDYSITVKDKNGLLMYSSLFNNQDGIISYTNNISDLSLFNNINTSSLIIVKDLDRGGTFIWNSTGTANDGTVFAGATGFWYRQHSGDVNLKWFGAKGDGTTDDTVSFQKAIDYTSTSTTNNLICSKGYVYRIGQLVPKDNVIINLNNSTIKSINGSTTPIFFDNATASLKYNFGVINGTLDGNKLLIVEGNVTGGIWLTNWDTLTFENLTMDNGYRIGLNLIGVKNVTITNYTYKNGGFISSAYINYALNIEAYGVIRSNNIVINNMKVSDCVGYGIHFFRCDNFVANNITFTNLTRTTTSIGITFTEATQGRVTNITCDNITGDSIEINDSYNIDLINTKVNAAGIRALLVGFNTVGLPYNNKITIHKFVTTNTIGTFAAALSNCINCEFVQLEFDKKITYDNTQTLSVNNYIRNSIINDTMLNNNSIIYYRKFALDNVNFTDYSKISFRGNKFTVNIPSTTVAIAGVLNLPMTAIGIGFLSIFSVVHGSIRLRTNNIASFSQCSIQGFNFVVNNFGTAANISTPTIVSGAVNRSMTVSGDAVGKQIVLTNGSGVEVIVAVEIEFIV